MVLDNYIKQDFVKQVFMESCLFVSDIWQVEVLVKSYFDQDQPRNIIFETSYLKYSFFNKFKIYYPKIRIINCDSSKSRLLNDIQECKDYLIIFDKINYCEDFDIFNMINKMNRILVC